MITNGIARSREKNEKNGAKIERDAKPEPQRQLLNIAVDRFASQAPKSAFRACGCLLHHIAAEIEAEYPVPITVTECHRE